MKQWWCVLGVCAIAALIGGCSDSVPRSEHEALKARLQSVEQELDELRNGPDRLLAQAKSNLADGKPLEARDAARTLVNRHEGTTQAAEAKALLAEAERKLAEVEARQQREAQEAQAKKEHEAEEARKSEEKRLANSMRMLRKEADEVRGLTFYQHKGSAPHLASRSELLAYFAVGKDSSKPTLRMRIQYVADDWLFIERYIIKADDQTYRITAGFNDVERDNGAGTIWEWYDVPVEKTEREILDAILSAKKVTLRHEGKQYYKDRVISPAERQRLAEVLTAYEAFLTPGATARAE